MKLHTRSVGVLYRAWICNSVGLLSRRRRRTPLLLDNTAARNFLANYGTNGIECTSPLGVNIVLPGDEKENQASCIDINFVGEADDVSVTSADEEALEILLGHPESDKSYSRQVVQSYVVLCLINLVCVLPHR